VEDKDNRKESRAWERPYTRGAAPDLAGVRSQRRLRLLSFSSLKRDFDDRCCYCTGKTIEKGGEENFDVEHFRPKSRPEFAHLEFQYSNLYYACRGCNLAKGARWPSAEDPEKRFIDPCEEAIYPKFLQITNSGEIIAGAPPGAYLLDVFRLKTRWSVRRMLRVRLLLKEVSSALREEDLNRAQKGFDELEQAFENN
jgi:uncharacterized protein (TIGR02646 family)